MALFSSVQELWYQMPYTDSTTMLAESTEALPEHFSYLSERRWWIAWPRLVFRLYSCVFVDLVDNLADQASRETKDPSKRRLLVCEKVRRPFGTKSTSNNSDKTVPEKTRLLGTDLTRALGGVLWAARKPCLCLAQTIPSVYISKAEPSDITGRIQLPS